LTHEKITLNHSITDIGHEYNLIIKVLVPSLIFRTVPQGPLGVSIVMVSWR